MFLLLDGKDERSKVRHINSNDVFWMLNLSIAGYHDVSSGTSFSQKMVELRFSWVPFFFRTLGQTARSLPALNEEPSAGLQNVGRLQ